MAEEEPFLAAARPWEQADVIVSGCPDLRHDPDTEVVLGVIGPPEATGRQGNQPPP